MVEVSTTDPWNILD